MSLNFQNRKSVLYEQLGTILLFIIIKLYIKKVISIHRFRRYIKKGVIFTVTLTLTRPLRGKLRISAH